MFNFLGLGKKKEFFIEAESTTETAATQASSAGVGQPETTPVAATAAAAVAEPVAATETAAPKSGKTSIRTKKAAADTADAAPVAAMNGTTPNGYVPGSAPTPVAPVTFAASTLLVNSTARRRPGPSLDKFKVMAKEIRPR